MQRWLRPLAACVLATLAAEAHAKAQVDGSLAFFGDTEDGTSLEADLSLSPNDWSTLSIGGGSSDSSSDLADLQGTSVRASVDVHSARFGFRPYYSRWSDSDDFTSATVGARAYVQRDGLVFELIGERRSLDVDFTVRQAPNRLARNGREFDGTGFGASLSYFARRWGGYVEAKFYDYDRNLEQLVAISRAPNIERFPRIQALVGSLLTLTRGALDYELAAGLERSAVRSSLRFDWVAVEDAIDGLQANSASVSFLYVFTPAFDAEITVGLNDSESIGSAGFAGLTFGFHR